MQVLTTNDVAEALEKQLKEGGVFDTHTWERAQVVLDDEGVKLLGHPMTTLGRNPQILAIFANEQVFEITVRERK